ncbi:leucine--tRNA ligase, partial [Marivirga lumbricoides]
FNLPVREVVENDKIVNSDFLTGLPIKEAIAKAVSYIEEKGIGKGKVNYRMRDAIFSRQRYWGEPVPVYFKNDIPYLLEEDQLPLELPEVDKYLPTEDGEPPLARAKNWKTEEGYELEKSTMPGWAGSSWYMFRYMDPHNSGAFVDQNKQEYWKNVDLYIGGSEHATGHLLYSRFWTKFLFDLGYITVDEPFQKMINQGMIQGRSNFVYRVEGKNTYVSKNLKDDYTTQMLHVDVNIVFNDELDIEKFRRWRPENADAEFILEDGKYICGTEIEKMSKSKHNVVNPDDVIEQYGADTLRLYEMFLGPLEQFKPWNTNGIDGTSKFLKKLWRLFHNDKGDFSVSEDTPDKKALKALHLAIQKVEYDIEHFSFNTSVSTFMICVNTLTDLKCNNKEILSDLVRIIAPYAPHICEELWELLGNKGSISEAGWPVFNPEFIKENDFTYPVSVNGKHRDNMTFAVNSPKEEIEKAVLANPVIQKWVEGKPIKKMIIVPNKIVNIVV